MNTQRVFNKVPRAIFLVKPLWLSGLNIQRGSVLQPCFQGPEQTTDNTTAILGIKYK